jgi:hypothetical protein
MKTTGLIVAVALLAGCAERSSDSGENQNAPVPLTPAAETETDYPMTGELSGVDKVRVSARIRLTEGRQVEGRPSATEADLMLAGETVSGMDIGLGLRLSRFQLQNLMAGRTIALDGLSGVSYGVPTKQVTQPLLALQLSGPTDGVASLRLTLGQESARDEGAPAELGRATELVVRGAFTLDCLVPAGDGSHRTLEDPRHTTAFCQGLTNRFQLGKLVGMR